MIRAMIDRWIARRAFNALSTFANNLDGKTYTVFQTSITNVLDLLRGRM